MRWPKNLWKRLSVLALAVSAAACASTTPVAVHRPPPPWIAEPSAPQGVEPQVLAGLPPMQCVPYARTASGIEIYGDANTWWVQAEGRYPRSFLPAPGSVLVLRGYNDLSRGHVAVVSAVLSERVIRVDQANWLNEGEVTLSVPVQDVSPNNDWSQVRVWYIPTADWGARTYEAEGFIHPLPAPPLA